MWAQPESITSAAMLIIAIFIEPSLIIYWITAYLSQDVGVERDLTHSDVLRRRVASLYKLPHRPLLQGPGYRRRDHPVESPWRPWSRGSPSASPRRRGPRARPVAAVPAREAR